MTKSNIKYLLLIFISLSIVSCSKNFLFIKQVKIIERSGKLEFYDTKLKRLDGNYLIYDLYGQDKLFEFKLKNGILNGKTKVYSKNPEFKVEEYKTKSWGLTKTMEAIPKQYSILNKIIEYKDGIANGVSKEYYSNGNLKRIVEIVNGSIIKYEDFNLENQVIKENTGSEKTDELFNLKLPIVENLLD